MKLKDVLMTCSHCTMIMESNNKLLGINTCYFDTLMMLSENLLESDVKKLEPDGKRIKIWLKRKESE